MPLHIDDGDPCECGSRSYDVAATLIACVSCRRTWGRVNDLWVFDPDSEPRPTQDSARRPGAASKEGA